MFIWILAWRVPGKSASLTAAARGWQQNRHSEGEAPSPLKSTKLLCAATDYERLISPASPPGPRTLQDSGVQGAAGLGWRGRDPLCPSAQEAGGHCLERGHTDSSSQLLCVPGDTPGHSRRQVSLGEAPISRISLPSSKLVPLLSCLP